MRIIAGEFRGRTLQQPADRRVRPTAARVREAWFSILAPELTGASVVDLFAGSGALGLEALSRGAEHADFVEIGGSSLAALRANIESFGVGEHATVHRSDALRFARKLAPDSYHIAFADPPYSSDQAERLAGIFRERRFAYILGIEHRTGAPVAGDETRRYGDISLTFCYAR